MRKLNSLGLASTAGLLALSIAPQAFSHSYMEYPPARQHVCHLDGGYWGASDGSQIPNAACRTAFIQSGWYPFVQQPEFARLVSDYQNQAAVELAIPDGSLCSAADKKKAGMDIPSPDWQKTPITLDTHGQLTLRYRAETPHNPSFWQFYLTKPGFDAASQPLTWADLTLVDQAGDVPVTTINGLKYYEITITLPTDRQGDAVLYSRWQRHDPAGEGFYNCSDISFGEGPAQPEVPAPIWTSAGPLLKATTDASAGDTVWFRIFNAQGQEQLFEKMAITVANQDEAVWAAALADIVNRHASDSGRIGREGTDRTIAFDPADLYANQVYLQQSGYTFRLEVKAEEPIPPTLPGETTTWEASRVYNTGDSVVYEGVTYVAKWWTKGEHPGQSAVWEAQHNDSIPAWQAGQAYQAGTIVTFSGQSYKARWWTQGDQPTSGGPWQQQ